MAKRILLVEDEPGLQLTLSDRLGSEGYTVETAGNGEDGYTRAMEGAFDLVILDVMLPDKNGFDVCRDLRQAGVGVGIRAIALEFDFMQKLSVLIDFNNPTATAFCDHHFSVAERLEGMGFDSFPLVAIAG